MKTANWGAVICATAITAVSATGAPSSSNNCKAVVFTVNATATNRAINASIPLGSVSALQAAFNAAAPYLVSGPQQLAATYCTPLSQNSNNNKLQMLYGSITGNRGDWDGDGGVGTDFPSYEREYYSYVLQANYLGYPTLAIDRLGTGKSSHPDPILVVQAPYEIALYNALAKQVRSGSTGVLPRGYNFLIYVGNSYGSQLGTGTAGADPTAYDTYILTGYSYNVQQDFAGVSLTLPEPAAVVDPARFGTLPPGYVTTSSQVGRTNSFFGSKAQVNFSDVVANNFFVRKDVVSLGQFASVYGIVYEAPQYKGRVLVLTGEQDQAFCGPGSPVIGPAMCGNQLRDTKVLFPAAQYNYKSVNRVGHAIQLHYRTPVAYAIADSFLSGANFQGGPPA